MEENFETNMKQQDPNELLKELEQKIDILLENKKELSVENFNLREKLKDVNERLKGILAELRKLKEERG